MAAELIAQNYRLELPVFKKFHRNVIGKGGSTIRKIKEETKTQIEIPTENSSSDVIIITGYKEQVEKAKAKILAIESELVRFSLGTLYCFRMTTYRIVYSIFIRIITVFRSSIYPSTSKRGKNFGRYLKWLSKSVMHVVINPFMFSTKNFLLPEIIHRKS